MTRTTLPQFGHYRTIRKLDGGATATVYLASDPQLNRRVAIKVISHFLSNDPKMHRLFEKEAKIIAGLEHEAIVPLYGFDYENDQPYLVMRFMPGRSLARYLEKNGAVSLEKAVEWLWRLAPALDMAHNEGVVHRDLKPGNILFDGEKKPYIADFGIAKVVSETTTLGMYKSGNPIGTSAYMSPELAQGEKKIDRRSDIYSLGVTLFELLTGRPPYQSSTPAGFVYQHIYKPVPNILEIKPDLPPECQTVIARAMAKKPEERYATAGEMAMALKSVAEGKPLSPPPAPPPPLPAPPPAPSPPTPTRRLIAIVAGVAISIIIIVTMLVIITKGVTPTPEVATETATSILATSTAALATSTPTSVETPAPPAPPTDTPALPTAAPAPPTDTPALPTAAPAPPTDTPVPPTAAPAPPTQMPAPAPTDTPTELPPTSTATPTVAELTEVGNAHYNNGEYEQAVTVYTQALVLEPAASIYFGRGTSYLAIEEYDKAIEDYTEAIRLDGEYAKAYNQRGTAHKKNEAYDKAIEDYDKAIEIDGEYANAYFNRGYLHEQSGKRQSAIDDYRKVVQLNNDPEAIERALKGLRERLRVEP